MLRISTEARLVPVLALLLLAGCASAPEKADEAAAVAEAPAEAVRRFEDGLALMQGGEDERAARVFEKLANDFPRYAGPWLNLGILYARAGRDAEAETAFREALARSPGNAAALNEIGILCRRQGRFEEAKAAYEEAIAAASDYALTYRNYGVLLDLYMGDPVAALSAYENYQSLSLDEDDQVTRWIAEVSRRIDASQRTAKVTP